LKVGYNLREKIYGRKFIQLNGKSLKNKNTITKNRDTLNAALHKNKLLQNEIKEVLGL
jgi:hypothetical protein